MISKGAGKNTSDDGVHSIARYSDVSDDKIAAIYAPTGEKVTRKELKRRSQSLAYGLRHKLGLQPGEVS